MSKLRNALQAASDHLDYIGYGDAWERSTAESLPAQIVEALAEKPNPFAGFSTLEIDNMRNALKDYSSKCRERHWYVDLKNCGELIKDLDNERRNRPLHDETDTYKTRPD